MLNNNEKYLSEFWGFYNPPIANEIKSLWLKNADTSYAFYRAFVPLFYRVLFDAKSKSIEKIKELANHKGWIVGDPHPANFGAILTGNSPINQSLIYTVNDPDDGMGGSSIYLDFLRFLTGVHIIEKSRYPIKKIRKAYHRGLMGESFYKQPKEIKECLNRLWKNEKTSQKRDYKRFFEERKSKANSPIVDILPHELTDLTVLLKNQWQDQELKVDQGFKYIRTKGGSGGLARIVLLVKFSHRKKPIRISRSKWLVIELKGMRQPSTNNSSIMTSEEVKIAQAHTMNWQSRNKLSNLYRIVKDKQYVAGDSSVRDTVGQYWTVRPRWVENPMLDPSEVKQFKNRKEIYKYQANVLGQLHRVKANDSIAYHNDEKRLKNKDWKKAVELMADKLDIIRLKINKM